MDENLRREIILDNYEHPFHKDEDFNDDSFIKINTNNESCIDDLDIYFKMDGNLIKDAYFKGEACTISTSATSIMLKKLIGKSKEDAKKLSNVYVKLLSMFVTSLCLKYNSQFHAISYQNKEVVSSALIDDLRPTVYGE